MTYNPDYSAALNQARSTSGALQGLGQKIGAIPEKMRQQEQQAQMQKIMGAAAQGDKEALNTLYSVNPDVAKQLEDRMYANQDRQQQGDDRLKSQIAMDTADAVERIAFAKSPEEATAMFDAYVGDERFDIDEEDRELFMLPEKQRAVIGAVKGEEYANSLFGKPVDSIKDREASVKEGELELKKGEFNAKREEAKIKALDAKEKGLDRQLQRETNQLKKKELEQKILATKENKEKKLSEIANEGVKAVTDIDETIFTAKEVLSHPGLDAAVGGTSFFPTMPGSDAANFEAKLDQFKSKQFLTNIKKMVGMGSLSEAEGQKIAAAAGALSLSMSEEAFRSEMKTVMAGLEKAKSFINKKYKSSTYNDVVVEDKNTNAVNWADL